MTATRSVDQVDAYIDEVRARLAGLPDEERAELVDEIASHVREVAREHGGDQLGVHLGSPAQFADELRAAAGYAPAAASNAGISAVRRLVRVTAAAAPVRAAWTALAPTWWLIRGVALGYAVCFVAGVDREVVPRVGNSRLVFAAVMVAAIVASYRFAERDGGTSAWTQRARLGVEALIVVLALAFAADATRTRVVYVDTGAQPVRASDACLRDSAGRPIGNLFAFDLSGAAIDRFFLTDQAGRPIDNLCPDRVPTPDGLPLQTTYAKDPNGSPVYNVFPRSQVASQRDPATGELRPGAPVPAPAVVFPQVAPRSETSPTTTIATTSTTVTPPQP